MEWRDIPGYEGYRISDTGVVQSRWKANAGRYSVMLNTWTTLKRGKSNGYWRVNLRVRQGKKRPEHVHVLMLIAFVGPAPAGQIGRHLDDNKDRNVIDNLAWGTHLDNSRDCLRNGRRPMGETHYAAKLTREQVDEIRQSDLSDEDAAAKYGVSKSNIYSIRCGERWNEGSLTIVRRGIYRKLSDSQVAEIRASPETTVELARRFNVSQPYVSHIKTGRSRSTKEK